jgi:hypothetical protein
MESASTSTEECTKKHYLLLPSGACVQLLALLVLYEVLHQERHQQVCVQEQHMSLVGHDMAVRILLIDALSSETQELLHAAVVF